jgi:uncharacterized protein with GYD domain
LIFVSFGRFRKKPTKETITEPSSQTATVVKEMAKEGIKVLSWYWTLGRYDTLFIAEAPDEKTFMKAMLRLADWVATETMVAVPREEAIRLVE